jgi:hypothetical protein
MASLEAGLAPLPFPQKGREGGKEGGKEGILGRMTLHSYFILYKKILIKYLFILTL